MNIFLYADGKEISGGRLMQKFSAEKTGIFETLRVYRGKIFRQEDHLARLAESAKTVGFSGLPDSETIRREMRLALQAYQTTNGAGRQSACHQKAAKKELTSPAVFIRPTLFADGLFIMIWERGLPAGIYEKGIAVKTSPVRRSDPNAWPAQVKTSAFHHGVAASLALPSAYTFEWLMLDRQGFAAEVRTGNLFIVKKNRLLTPPARGILNGVTRLFVIECALLSGIQVEERPLTRHEIFNADEAFLTNTSWEIVPVRELDSRRIAVKIPGLLTQKLQKIFKKRTLQECP